jgi:hypothetical protein
MVGTSWWRRIDEICRAVEIGGRDCAISLLHHLSDVVSALPKLGRVTAKTARYRLIHPTFYLKLQISRLKLCRKRKIVRRWQRRNIFANPPCNFVIQGVHPIFERMWIVNGIKGLVDGIAKEFQRLLPNHTNGV